MTLLGDRAIIASEVSKQLSRRTAIFIAVGIADGLFAGLTGVGGGAIVVPMLVDIVRLSQHQAHGTSLAIMILAVTGGAIAYASRGSFDVALFVGLSLGSLVGVFVGARLMMMIPARQLRRVFGVVIVFVGVLMLLP